jgi:hypothetical protein
MAVSIAGLGIAVIAMIVATLTCTLVPLLHIAPPLCSSDDVESPSSALVAGVQR